MVANYLSRRRVSLASTPLPTTKAPPAILVSDGAMEKIFAGGQSTYAQTLTKAKAGENVSHAPGFCVDGDYKHAIPNGVINLVVSAQGASGRSR